MSTLFEKFDTDKLKTEIGGTLAQGLAGVVEGAAEDLRAFGLSIAGDLLEARLTGDARSEAALIDQLKVLAEINRIRVEAKMWIVAEKIVKVVFSAVLATALAAL